MRCCLKVFYFYLWWPFCSVEQNDFIGPSQEAQQGYLFDFL